MKTPQVHHSFSLFALFLLVIVLGSSCKKTTTPTATSVTIPVVTTADVIINVTSTTAQSGGVVTSSGDDVIAANGVCYSTTNKTPTVADSKTSDIVNTSIANFNFISNLTGLTANTTYYVRAYATNSAGTGYGSVIQFTTGTSSSPLVATVSTFAGSGTAGYLDATGLNAKFNNPEGLTADANGNIFVSDSYNSYIRQISLGGSVTTVAGNGTIGYMDATTASLAEFYSPQGLAFDSKGNLYIADYGNNVIRKITTVGVVSTFAGNGVQGYVDASNAANAEFNGPGGIAFDAQDNMYVADRGNNLIRKITSAGVVSTFAGKTTAPTAGYANATGTSAAFNAPNGVAVDKNGNIYVADEGNSAIRKITSAGVVTTIAGGPSLPDLLNYPAAIAVDKQGNFFILDEGGRVLEYTTANVLYTLAGSLNSPGLVNGPGSAAKFNNPQGIAVDANGNIFVADKNNNCIREITVTAGP